MSLSIKQLFAIMFYADFSGRMLNVLISACRFASTAGLAVLLVNTPSPVPVSDPASIALWGIVVTSAAGIILQILRSSADARRDERRHRFEIDNRRESTRERAEIIKALEVNAGLVKSGNEKAEAAFVAANDVNGKFEKLAAAALAAARQGGSTEEHN